jgi:ribosomal protein L31
LIKYLTRSCEHYQSTADTDHDPTDGGRALRENIQIYCSEIHTTVRILHQHRQKCSLDQQPRGHPLWTDKSSKQEKAGRNRQSRLRLANTTQILAAQRFKSGRLDLNQRPLGPEQT